MKPGKAKAHVGVRWSKWLRQQMLAGAVATECVTGRPPGALTESQEWDLVRSVVTPLAATFASDPKDRNTHPRGNVWRWLRDEMYVSPERCFRVSQGLSSIGVSPGGALGLLAAGHAPECLKLLNALLAEGLRGSTIDDPPAKKRRSKRDGAARDVVAYVIRFIGHAFVAISDLDDVRGIGGQQRADALAELGAAPLEALDRAWDHMHATPLPITISPSLAERRGPHAAALIAFAAFAELVAQDARREDAWRSLLATQYASWQAYLSVVHAEQPR